MTIVTVFFTFGCVTLGFGARGLRARCTGCMWSARRFARGARHFCNTLCCKNHSKRV